MAACSNLGMTPGSFFVEVVSCTPSYYRLSILLFVSIPYLSFECKQTWHVASYGTYTSFVSPPLTPCQENPRPRSWTSSCCMSPDSPMQYPGSPRKTSRDARRSPWLGIEWRGCSSCSLCSCVCRMANVSLQNRAGFFPPWVADPFAASDGARTAYWSEFVEFVQRSPHGRRRVGTLSISDVFHDEKKDTGPVPKTDLSSLAGLAITILKLESTKLAFVELRVAARQTPPLRFSTTLEKFGFDAHGDDNEYTMAEFAGTLLRSLGRVDTQIPELARDGHFPVTSEVWLCMCADSGITRVLTRQGRSSPVAAHDGGW